MYRLLVGKPEDAEGSNKFASILTCRYYAVLA